MVNEHLASPAHADYDVRMAMALETGGAARLQFEVSQVEPDPLAAHADQHLARRAAELAVATGRELVGFELDVVPSESAPEAANRRW